MSSGIKRLVLLGAGPSHLQVLRHLTQQHQADLKVVMVSPYAQVQSAPLLPALVASGADPALNQTALQPMLQAAGVQWQSGRCVGLDAQAQRLWVQGPEQQSTLQYDWLSIDHSPQYDAQTLDMLLPGARENGLLRYPAERFVRLWPEVEALAQSRPVSLAVVGADAAAVEMVLAIEARFSQLAVQGIRYTLVCGDLIPGAEQGPGVAQRIKRHLKQRGITVLAQHCSAVQAGALHLEPSGQLQCDVPVIALPDQAPAYLRPSGLSLDPEGRVATNLQQQSQSHANVFASVQSGSAFAGQHSEAWTQSAGAVLAHNLIAQHQGRPLVKHKLTQSRLQLLSCGNQHAIASFGPLHAEGAWVWHWKERLQKARK